MCVLFRFHAHPHSPKHFFCKRHTVPHKHVHTITKHYTASRISHRLPRACLCCSECIATGNLTHHNTRGSWALAAIQCSKALAAANILLKGKQHPMHRHPTTVSVNYCEFFKSLSCLSSSCWTGGEMSSMVSEISVKRSPQWDINWILICIKNYISFDNQTFVLLL